MDTRKLAPIGMMVLGTFTMTGGCGSDTIAIDDFPAALVRAGCKRVVRCGGAVDQATCEASTFIDQNEAGKKIQQQ